MKKNRTGKPGIAGAATAKPSGGPGSTSTAFKRGDVRTDAEIRAVIPSRGPVVRVVLWCIDDGGDVECEKIGQVFTEPGRAATFAARHGRSNSDIVTVAEYVRRRRRLLVNAWREYWDGVAIPTTIKGV